MESERTSDDSAGNSGGGTSGEGRVLGRYRVVREIGGGSTCLVSLARVEGPNGFERWVALKSLRPARAADKEFVAAFLDETRAAACVGHANVASVLELGHEGGAYWVATEHVYGESLASILERAARTGVRIPLAAAFRIVVDAADGLHAAHDVRRANGTRPSYVHGALSPASIFVGYDGVVKLVDIGLPRSPDSARARAYAAPERGLKRAHDRRVDVYSLAAILKELCASADAKVPVRLATVLERALARNPSVRPQSARDFSRALATATLQVGLFADREELAELVHACFPGGPALRRESLHDAELPTEVFHRSEDLAALLAQATAAKGAARAPMPSNFDDACETLVQAQPPPSAALWYVKTAHESGSHARAAVLDPPTLRPVTGLVLGTLGDDDVYQAHANRARRSLVVAMLAAGGVLAFATVLVVAIPTFRNAQPRAALASSSGGSSDVHGTTVTTVASAPVATACGAACDAGADSAATK